MEILRTRPCRQIANKYGVTMQIEEDALHILGLRGSVKKALEALKDCDSSSELPGTPDSLDVKTGGALIAGNSLPVQSQKNGKTDTMHSPCPTCKACPFCPSCGHPTTFVDTAEPSGFATEGAGNGYSQVPWMWRQMPVMPYEGGNGNGNGQMGVMNFPVGNGAENMVPMAFMVPGSQNMQVCFVPAAMMAG